MKIAVLNFSGNVGKTTVAAHLLKPRMGDTPVYSIESINTGADADGIEVEKMKGKKFGELVDELMLLDAARVSGMFTEHEVKQIRWSVLDDDPGAVPRLCRGDRGVLSGEVAADRRPQASARALSTSFTPSSSGLTRGSDAGGRLRLSR